MERIDLKKRYPALYKPSAKLPSIVEVPPLRFLMLDGQGEVGGHAFQEAMTTLFALAYTIRFGAKKHLDIDVPVMPAEGLYWNAADGSNDIDPAKQDEVAWRLQLLLAAEIPGEFVETMRDKVAAKKDPPRLAEVRVQTFSEGTCVTMLHMGRWEDETPTIDRMIEFADGRGFDVTGRHHEIYLSDPSRTAPSDLKTVLRYGITRRHKPSQVRKRTTQRSCDRTAGSSCQSMRLRSR